MTLTRAQCFTCSWHRSVLLNTVVILQQSSQLLRQSCGSAHYPATLCLPGNTILLPVLQMLWAFPEAQIRHRRAIMRFVWRNSFPQAGGEKGGLGGVKDKKGNTAFVLAKQHNFKSFIKVIPKCHSIKLYETELLLTMNNQKTSESIFAIVFNIASHWIRLQWLSKRPQRNVST